MGREFERAKARYRAQAAEALHAAAGNLAAHLPQSFSITNWTRAAQEAYGAQWNGGVTFDWPEVFRRHANEPDRLEMAVWTKNDTLAALALAVCAGQFVELRFLEGSPDAACPLRRFRAAIALEASACYAQLRGRTELRLRPLNDAVKALYIDVYGFEAVERRDEKPYLRKVIG